MLTRDRLVALMEEACRAPTPDNSQPWAFGWNGDRLEVRLVEARAAHALDRNHNASLVGLGCMLESVSLAASRQGCAVDVAIAPETTGAEAETVVAHVRLVTGGAAEDPLASLAATRHTDRRIFDGGSLDEASRTELTALGAASGCKVAWVASPSTELRDYVIRSDQYMFRSVRVFSDVARWFRLTKAEIETRDGMGWANLGLSSVDAVMFRAVRRWPGSVKVLWPMLKPRIAGTTRSQITSSAGLLTVSVPSPIKREALIVAGRIVLRAWLLLQRAGLAVHPMNLSTLPALDLATGFAHEGMPDDLVEHYRGGPDVLRRAFGLSGDDFPVWLFRAGRAPKAALPTTLRLPLDRVLSTQGAAR